VTYRLLADENVELATRRYLRQLGHDVEWVGDVPTLGLGVSDEAIVAHARDADRLVLTQDDDFLTEFDPGETNGVLFQRDQRLSARQVGDAVDAISRYVPQDEVVLEYVSTNWL